MLDKAIKSGKEKRKQYYGSKAFDFTCHNHGSCSYCADSRQHRNNKRIQEAYQRERDFYENIERDNACEE